MSTALATQDVNMDELKRLGMMLALSGYFDQHNDQGVATAQMCVKVLAGREIGFGPFAAVNGIHIIKGKPSISANIMAAAVKSHPTYDYRVRVMTDKEVAIDFFEIMDGKRESVGKSEFTAADAAKAGTQNMGKFPRNMLFARAMSNGVRWYCPDVFSGNSVYTPEELGARTDDDGYIIVDRASGEIIESPKPAVKQPVKPAPKQPAIKSLSEVEPLSFDAPLGAIDEFLAIPSPKTGQTAKEHTESQAAQVQSTKRPDWNNPIDAKAWAEKVGACANEHEAASSLRKIIDNQFGGRLLPSNMDAVLDAFYARQMEKLGKGKGAEATPL
jgi:hypothetical protein